MLTKESKIKILENFYALDYIFFGKSVKEMKHCDLALVEDYMSIKGALLSVMVEMFKLVDHTPKPVTEKVSSKILFGSARIRAKIAREMSHKLVSTEKGRADVKAELREVMTQKENIDINATVEKAIRTKAFRLASDNLLIAATISEAANFEEMNEWSGRIIEDSYKILRDSLVDSALIVLS